jgi:hypothetical protein
MLPCSSAGDEPTPTSQTPPRGRASRRPLPAGSLSKGALASSASSASSAAAAAVAASSGLDPEARAVLDKFVGGLTKDGRKTRAERIMADALSLIRERLRRGKLDELK